MNLRTGKRLFLVRKQQKQGDFQAFLRLIHSHYRGWKIALLLDENPSHTANRSERMAIDLNIKLLWLPKRSPELNPMDELWGQAKDVVSANKQYASIDEHVVHFLDHLQLMPDTIALRTSGVHSGSFWLRSVLSQNFCPPA